MPCRMSMIEKTCCWASETCSTVFALTIIWLIRSMPPTRYARAAPRGMIAASSCWPLLVTTPITRKLLRVIRMYLPTADAASPLNRLVTTSGPITTTRALLRAWDSVNIWPTISCRSSTFRYSEVEPSSVLRYCFCRYSISCVPFTTGVTLATDGAFETLRSAVTSLSFRSFGAPLPGTETLSLLTTIWSASAPNWVLKPALMPSPRPTSTMTAETPMMIPIVVSAERSRLARRLRMAIANVSLMCIVLLLSGSAALRSSRHGRSWACPTGLLGVAGSCSDTDPGRQGLVHGVGPDAEGVAAGFGVPARVPVRERASWEGESDLVLAVGFGAHGRESGEPAHRPVHGGLFLGQVGLEHLPARSLSGVACGEGDRHGVAEVVGVAGSGVGGVGGVDLEVGDVPGGVTKAVAERVGGLVTGL